MKTKLTSVIAIFALGLTAGAQTGTYRDTTLSLSQRVTAAKAVITTGTSSTDVMYSALFILNVQPPAPVVSIYPALADSVLADPTLGGIIQLNNTVSADSMKAAAVIYKSHLLPDAIASQAYLSSKMTDGTFSVIPQVLSLTYRNLTRVAAQMLINQGNPTAALSTGSAGFPYNPVAIAPIIAKAKIALHSSDALNWAVLSYYLTSFAKSPDGIQTVANALKALDNTTARANAFLQYQNDGQGTNAISGVSMPSVAINATGTATLINAGQLPLWIAVTDPTAALQAAQSNYANASGNQLGQAADTLAAALRNYHLNLVRANAYTQAQTSGSAFAITELQ